MSRGCLYIREHSIIYPNTWAPLYTRFGAPWEQEVLFCSVLHFWSPVQWQTQESCSSMLADNRAPISEQTLNSPAISLSLTHLFSSLHVTGKPRISSQGQSLSSGLKKKQYSDELRYKSYYLVTSCPTLKYISTFFCFVS